MENLNNVGFELIDVNSLLVAEYQRPVDKLRIKKMMLKFDESLLGAVIVSHRDGKYYVVDGQHRIVLCRKKGVTHIMAVVLEGLTLQEEAAYFNRYNGARGERKILNKETIFNADVISGDDVSIDIKKIVESVGFKLGKGKSTNTICSYETIKRIYEKEGSGHFTRVMKMLADIWNGDADSLNRYIISGVSEFLKTYSSEPNYSDSRFIKQLSKVEPSLIVREMRSDISSNVNKVRILNTMFKYYNKNLIKKLVNRHFALTEG